MTHDKLHEQPEHAGFDNRTTQADQDLDLYHKVNSTLQANYLINSGKITVSVKDRCVYLEGSVPSETERSLVAKCIADIFGVRTIANNITFPFDPGHGKI